MIAFNPNSLCAKAEPYYYDFLLGTGEKPVPEEIVRHVEECRSCRDKLSQLEAALSQADDVDAERQADSAIATMLRLHFAYIGKPVTCRIVKPFLPTLLDPVLQIRVPTPITVHLNNCPQCSEDLQAIAAMSLSRKQLGRLSRLFADSPLEDAAKCSQVHLSRTAAALLALNKATAEALKHICVCPDCRKALYQHRQIVREDFLRCGEVQENFPCEQVSDADIFDYCIPYGIDPAADQYAEFRGSLASHLCSCPKCLGKMQELHNAVYEIVERPDSEVITTCHIDESVRVQTPSDPDDLYAGFPIRAETADSRSQAKAGQPVLSLGSAVALKKKVFAVNMKPLAKIAAVAAGILIVAALLLNTPSAKALTIAEIYRAIENIGSIYVASFVPDKKEPIQEQWVSRKFKVQLTKTKEEIVLWDVPDNLKRTKRLDSGLIETEPVSAETIRGIEQQIVGSLGLVPFDELPSLPKGYKWSPVSDKTLPILAEGIETYELTWRQETYGGPMIMMCRFFVDRGTTLPQRVEFYQKSAPDLEYNLRYVRAVKYLNDSEVQKAFHEPFSPSE